MLRFLLVISFSFLFLVACTDSGADLGFAPSAAVQPVTLPTTITTNHVKYGEVVTTGNGWTVSNDNTDSVEQKTLASGWKVQVKYE